MEYKNYLNLLKQRKQTVIFITALFLIVVAIFTFAQPLRYSATSRLLVVQNYGPNTDAYNVSRANQFLSNLLAQVVYSDAFYEKVMTSGYSLNPNIFSAEANKRKTEWQNAVYTRAVADTGMIVLKTYHQNKAVADLLNQAIAYTLMTKNAQFHGLGDNVKVKVIDNSTLSDWPVKPNAPLNMLLGLLVGLAAGLYFVYLFPNKNLGFHFRRRAAAPTITWSEPEAAKAETEVSDNRQLYGWQEDYREPEAAPVYNYAENESEGALDIEEAKDGDEFEPYFHGSINNVLNR